MARTKPQTIELEIPGTAIAYLRVIAFNRFLDNVERALKGDQDCISSLLGEDLDEVRDHIQPLIADIKDKTYLEH